MTKTSKTGSARDTLERELIGRDKQSIITYALRIFDEFGRVDRDRLLLLNKIAEQQKEIQTLKRFNVLGRIVVVFRALWVRLMQVFTKRSFA